MAGTKLGSLWEREGKKGKYFGGSLDIGQDRVKIVVFPNGYKKDNPQQPDWYIYQSEPREGA